MNLIEKRINQNVILFFYGFLNKKTLIRRNFNDSKSVSKVKRKIYYLYLPS
jgi:hypothetical protein